MGAERHTAAPGTWSGQSESGRVRVARPPGSGGWRAGRCRRPPGRSQQPCRCEAVEAHRTHTQGGLGANRVTSRLNPRQSGQGVPCNTCLPLRSFPRAPSGTPSPDLLRPSLHPVPRGVLLCGCSSGSVTGHSLLPASARTPRPQGVCGPLRDGLLQSPSGQPVRRPNLPQQPTRRTGMRSGQRWEGAPVSAQILPVVPGRPLCTLAWGWLCGGGGSSQRRRGIGQDQGVGCPGWPPTGVRAQGEKDPRKRGGLGAARVCVLTGEERGEEPWVWWDPGETVAGHSGRVSAEAWGGRGPLPSSMPGTCVHLCGRMRCEGGEGTEGRSVPEDPVGGGDRVPALRVRGGWGLQGAGGDRRLAGAAGGRRVVGSVPRCPARGLEAPPWWEGPRRRRCGGRQRLLCCALLCSAVLCWDRAGWWRGAHGWGPRGVGGKRAGGRAGRQGQQTE